MRVADESDQLDLQGMLLGQAREALARYCRAQVRTSRTEPSRRGLNPMICRHSSDPMEPPAPVTMTTRSRMQASNKPVFRRNRVSSQQIRHIDFAQIGQICLAGHELLDVGNRLHMHAQRLELSQNLAPAAARQRRHRKQDSIDAVRL